MSTLQEGFCSFPYGHVSSSTSSCSSSCDHRGHDQHQRQCHHHQNQPHIEEDGNVMKKKDHAHQEEVEDEKEKLLSLKSNCTISTSPTGTSRSKKSGSQSSLLFSQNSHYGSLQEHYDCPSTLRISDEYFIPITKLTDSSDSSTAGVSPSDITNPSDKILLTKNFKDRYARQNQELLHKKKDSCKTGGIMLKNILLVPPVNIAIVDQNRRSCILEVVTKILGFQTNHSLIVSSMTSATPRTSLRNGEDVNVGSSRNSPMADLRLSMLSNLSTSYNTLNISWAIQIMSRIYTISEGEQSICSTALLAGMIFGQLFGGALGDYIGRHKAMTIVMLTQIFAALGSSLCFDHHYDGYYIIGYFSSSEESFTIFKMLAVWRFLLGIGCGGVYPLAATLSAESTSCPQDKGKLVALAFSMQGIGYLLVPVFSWVLMCIFGESSDICWRIMLGSGSIFGLLLIALRTSSRRRIRRSGAGSVGGGEEQEQTDSAAVVMEIDPLSSSSISSLHEYDATSHPPIHMIANMEAGTPNSVVDTPEYVQHQYCNMMKQPDQDNKPASERSKNSSSLMESIRTERMLTRKLIGTAGCWFIFDVLFYGNTLFQPVVLHSVFGSQQETLMDAARDTSIMAMLALPGYFISIGCVGRQSPRFIQIQGFLCMSFLYAVIGSNFETLSHNRLMLLLLYGSTFFFSDYGPNTTTFMLPSMTFSPSCRSTLNGISAASGKVGAILGASLFEPAATHFGNNVVLLICSGLSILGALMTWFGVSPDVGLAGINDRHQEEYATAKVQMDRKKSAPSFLDYDGS